MLKFDARAWMVWLATAVIFTMTARNPFYTLVILLAARVVGAVCGQNEAGLSLPLARMGAAILAVTAVFNALMVHIGETVLFRLPSNWLWIGGPITLEAVVFGLGNGLILLALLVIFTTLNNAVSTAELVRLTPRALRDLGVVILIALTYLPETTRQLRRIRDAQAIRGHRLRGWRDWRPVLIPLLIGGLERAMGVAEAMVSRGYGATDAVRQPLTHQLALAVGLLAAFAGWVLSFWLGWPGWVLMGLGVAIILFLLWRLGQQTPHTRYRPQSWSKWDTGLAGTAVIPLIFIFTSQATLNYTPYPTLTMPPFDPFVGLGLLLLVFPAAAQQVESDD
ncbi:MAG: energy-coupling factor transporter transmembrane protein EcfT [Chloroflexi bacterium]|nr:energy-coupling factor transporter transmembrane protein EcfT [Chloroflexota bacterium]